MWIYHLDNARPATQGLKSNETVTQIYSARITDDSSAYIDQTITVSINGSNDAPVISLDFADSNSASLSETNVTLSASGSLSIADSDRGDIVNTEHTLIVSGTSNRSDPAAPTDAELLSMLTLTDNPNLDGTKQSGTLLWSFDSNIASPRDTTFNYLGFGETLILTYTITATDDGSPALSDSENLTITISGSNETPLITAGSNTTTLAQAAANLTTSGSVTVIDADTPDTVSASVVSVDLSGSFSSSGSTLPSSLSANSNQALLNMLTLSNPAPGSAMAADQAAGGSRFDWTFTTGSNGDAAFDFLREGETLVLTYTLDLTDNSGDAATQTSTTTVAITLTGTNESPLISDGADSASLSETNASISSSGSMTVTDIDLSDTITATVDAVAISGGSYTTRSGYNRSNDIPLTDAELKAMLALSVSSATTSTIPANPPNGSDVTWSFTSGASGSGPVGGNKDFEFLAAGESIQLTYTVLVQDNAPISSGQNAKTDSTTVVVTITGTNDTPDITVVDVSGAVTEDTSTTAAGNAIAQVNTLTLSGLYESGDALTASVNGVEVTYTVQAADVDSSDPAVTRQTVASRLADAINSNANLGDFITAMAAGSVLSISSDIPGRAFTLMTSAAAAAGGSDDTQAASMTAQTANASGQQLRDSGSISFTDRDLTDLSHVSLTFISSTASTGASLSAALDAALRDLSNSFTISGPGVSGAAADGSISWSFGIDNALSQYLGANQSITAIYRISISDDSGFAAVSGNDAISTASQDVTITITGANDGPMISLQTGNSDVDVISETDAGLNRTGSLTASDVDLTKTVSVSVQGVNATGGINGLTSTNAQLLAMLSLNPAASSAVLEKNEVVDQLNWSFDSGAEAFNHLAYGEKLHLTYTLRATDSSGASFDKTLGFTISGSNDLPSITITTADTATGALTEGDSPLTSNGTLSVADKDFSNIVSASVVSVQKAGITNGLAANDTALKAMLTASPTTVISSNNTAGTLAWSFNSGIEYFNHLGAGEQMTLTYTVRVSDSSGGTADQAIQLTITGSNDAPQLTIAPVAATEAVSAATQDLSISGTLSILDKDQGSIVTITPGTASVVWSGGGIPAGYDISALSAPSALILNGGTPSLVASAATVSLPWVYDPAALNLDWLREGQSLTITYPITVTDNQNAAVSQNLVIVLTGTNDTPLISQGNDSAAFTETGATLSETGTMLVEDLDWSDTVALSVDSVAFSGSFITNGRTLPSSLTSNTNQALRAMLALSSDSETISSLAATPGGGSEFNWTFTSGSSGTSAFNFLQQGETLTLTYTVAASDNSPVRAGKESSKATETVAVTITGTNNDPTITIETGDTATATLTETNGGLVNTLSLTVRDVDLSNTVSPSIDSVAISGSYPGLADLDNATIKSYLSTNFRFESGLLKFTADNAAEVYLNGSLIGSTNNWGQPYTFSNLNVLPGKNVLSVLAWDYGSIAAMSGLFTMADGSTFGTSNISGWKVFNADPVPTSDYSGNSTVRSAWNLPSGWNTVAYDDSDTALWRTPQDTRTVESWYP